MGERGVWVGEVEQLCLEVAPSILIDFICAHVGESEWCAAETEKESRGVFRGSASRGRARKNEGRDGAKEGERRK